MQSILLAAATLVALSFGNGEHANAAVAWLAPLLLLRFVRTRRNRRGLAAAWALAAIGWGVAWHAVFRAQGVELLVAAILFGGLNLLPYLLDRVLVPRLRPLAGTLVFPCAMVAFEFALASASPLGAWGMIAYTQAGIAPVAQLASVAGPWGIGFLIAWAASLANAVWAEPGQPRLWTTACGAFGVLLLAGLGYGGWRNQAAQPTAHLRVALLLPPVQDNLNYDTARAASIEAHLRAATLRAARGGARLVAWPEDSFFLPAGGEPALLHRVGALAREAGVHVAAAYGARESVEGLRYRNRLTLVTASGEPAWSYSKSHAVPGYEQTHMVPGDGRVAWAATPFGRVAGMICFDADHLAMIRQLRGEADLLLVPSDDWDAIEALHPAMLRLRAIEQGVPVVRPTINGRSVVFDARGRQWSPPARPATEPWLVDLPLEHLRPLYLRIGDTVAWASLAGLVLLAAFAARTRSR